MKPNNTNTIQNVSTEQFETVQMGFDQSAIVHLMSVLTNLYSDTALAVIREYSTNARDSHLTAGNTDPIEVFLPGPLNHNFRVKDYGIGLSTDDVYNIYSKYGRSTKRGNNVETGMLGLGCKSGLAYTKQFKLTGIKDGVKTLAVISRGDDGAGNITILDTVSTSEPNGVTIEVPARDTGEFARKARDFFKYWEKGSVLVDGQEPESLDGSQLSEDMMAVFGGYGSHDYVVMGGVPYPVRQSHISSNFSGLSAVAWVDMGDVEFTPSREDLLYTDKTVETLRGLRTRMNSSVERVARDEVSNAATPADAVRANQRWRRHIRNLAAEWNGLEIPSYIAAVHGDDSDGTFVYYTTRQRNAVSAPWRLDVDLVVSALHVTGFTNKSVSPSARAKIRQYIEENSLSTTMVILSEFKQGAPWSDDAPSIDYETIKAIKLPKSGTTGRRRPKEVFSCYINGTHSNLDVFPDKPIILTTSAYELSPRFLSQHYPESIVVVAGKNRWEKFQREHPKAVTLPDKLRAEARRIIDNWTAADAAHGMPDSDASAALRLSQLDAERVSDPELRLFLRAVSVKRNSDESLSNIKSMARQMKTERWGPGLSLDLSSPFDFGVVGTFFRRYPLLSHLDARNTGSMLDYINAMYEKENR